MASQRSEHAHRYPGEYHERARPERRFGPLPRDHPVYKDDEYRVDKKEQPRDRGRSALISFEHQAREYAVTREAERRAHGKLLPPDTDDAAIRHREI